MALRVVKSSVKSSVKSLRHSTRRHTPIKDTRSQLNDLILDGVTPVNDDLGRGTYGEVFTVRYGESLYAAKRIHTSITDEASFEEREAMKNDLIQECFCCSAIQHPNIVNLLGICYPKISDFPVMVMELMTCSLTSFIEKGRSQICTKIKISILYDVSVGLSFLHRHEPQIVHRDLSSNDIMLNSQLVAKIGDLGVAKAIRGDRAKSKLKLNEGPGTDDFMPSEILEGKSTTCDASVDVFSFGCVALHVFTEEWPKPSSPSKLMDIKTNKPVTFTEAERRKKYLDLMIKGDIIVLKELVKSCLNDNSNSRPPIEEATELIMQLKVPHLELHDPEESEEPPSFTEALQSDQYHIQWTSCASLPAPLNYASVAVCGHMVYVAGDAPSEDTEHNVYSYDTTTDCWQQLPQPGHRYGVLCTVDDKLVIFGGRDSATNAMHRKVTTYESDANQWISYYPNMLYVRCKPGVVAYEDHVIVMGGGYTINDNHRSIEIMNCHEMQWRKVTVRLPVPMYNLTPTISGKHVTIVGYSDQARQTTSYQILLSDIISPKDLPSWKRLNAATHYNTTVIPYSNPPVTVGGENHSRCTSVIKIYNTSVDSWIGVGYLTSARDTVGIAYINEYTIMVLGGTSGGSANAENWLNTVEIGHIIPY